MKLIQKIILALLVLCVLAGTVSAVNMSISNLGYTGDETVQIYANGTLLGTYNTSTNGIVLPDVDFVLVVKPTVWNQDIGASVGGWFVWLAEYWVAIVFLVCAIVLGISLGGRR